MSKHLQAAETPIQDLFRTYLAAHGGQITPDQFRHFFVSHGLFIAEWARAHGYTPRQVSLVLNGQIKARYGKSFDIAVTMGLKPAPADQRQLAA